MSWYLAKSLVELRRQVDERWPNRSKESDGSIGNAEHSARLSDHNPNEEGAVCAIDITHDPRSGCDSYALAEVLRAGKDPRIKYLISNRKICSGSGDSHPAWVWRPYPVPPNKNPHDHHVHVSVKGNYDDARAWNLDAAPMPVPAPSFVAPGVPPTLRFGDKGDAVKHLQTLLSIDADGSFGPKTLAAVKAFQSKAELTDDGIVGPQTWKALTGVEK